MVLKGANQNFFFHLCKKMDNIFLQKKKIKGKKNAASLLASKKDTWTGNRSFFRVAKCTKSEDSKFFPNKIKKNQ